MPETSIPPTSEPADGPSVAPTVVEFASLRGPYGAFSNFAPYPIALNGKQWPTNEHYFQAQKFAGTEHEEAIRLARSPMVAARMGRSRKRPLRPDWEAVKDGVMETAVRAKFTQHAELRRLLLSTADARIVEHRARDTYWVTVLTAAAATGWGRY